QALQLLGESERPIIVAGGGAFWSGAGDALRAFAERARIPVTAVNAARGLIADGEHVSLGPLSEGGFQIMTADGVVLVGTKHDAPVTKGGPPLFAGTEKLIQLDIEPTNIGLNRMPHVADTADESVVL